MAIVYDTPFLDSVATEIGDLLESGNIVIRDATQTTLVTIPILAGAFVTDGAGTARLAAPLQADAVADGDPVDFVVNTTGGGTMTGTVGGPASGADMEITNDDSPATDYVYKNAQITVSSFNIPVASAN